MTALNIEFQKPSDKCAETYAELAGGILKSWKSDIEIDLSIIKSEKPTLFNINSESGTRSFTFFNHGELVERKSLPYMNTDKEGCLKVIDTLIADVVNYPANSHVYFDGRDIKVVTKEQASELCSHYKKELLNTMSL